MHNVVLGGIWLPVAIVIGGFFSLIVIMAIVVSAVEGITGTILAEWPGKIQKVFGTQNRSS